MGFRSYVRHFRGAILGLLRPSLPWCFPIRGPAAAAKASAAAGGKGSQNSKQQQEEKAAKIIIFYGFQKLRWAQQEEKVAKLHIHSSSKKKKPPKSSFSMGFRSYVRHFRGAILGLLRPSLPWCFRIRGPAPAAAKASAAAGGKGSQTSYS